MHTYIKLDDSENKKYDDLKSSKTDRIIRLNEKQRNYTLFNENLGTMRKGNEALKKVSNRKGNYEYEITGKKTIREEVNKFHF